MTLSTHTIGDFDHTESDALVVSDAQINSMTAE